LASAPQSRSNLLIAAIVALAIVLAAIAEGGYSIEARAVLALLVWTAVIAGLGFGYLPRSRLPDAALVAASLLGVVAVLAGLSVAWASDDGTVVNEFIRASFYLGLFTLVICTSREGQMRAWLAGLALGIVAVGFIALLSRLIPPLPGGDEQISRLLPFATGRLSFPIGYWNGLAALLALGIVLLTWFAAFARAPGARAASTAAIPMLGLTMYLTSSRGGFSALTVGLVALIAIGPRRAPLFGSVLLGGLGAVLLIALANQQPDLLDAGTGSDATRQGAELLAATAGCTLLAWVARARLEQSLARLRLPPGRARLAIIVAALLAAAVLANPTQRFGDFKSVPGGESSNQSFVASHLASGSGSGRWQFWGEALDAFSSEPLHGIGAGGFADYWNQHAPIDLTVQDAHSLYLEQLGELGPLAPLALIGFLLLGAVRAVRERHLFVEGHEIAAAVSLIAAGALSAGIDWTWEIPVVFAPVVVAAALLCGPTLAVKAEAHFSGSGGSRGAAPWRGPFAWWAGLIVIGLLSWLLAWSSLLSQRSLDASRQAATDGKLKEAADDARDAIALQPWAAQPRLQLALVQEFAGDLNAADRSIREAIDRAPNDWELWLKRASIAADARHVPEAATAYQRARALNPHAPFFNPLGGTPPPSAQP
jgi:hypothetical protein